MGRKNENTVSVKLVEKKDSRNGKTSQFYRVIANKTSTMFKVIPSEHGNGFTLPDPPIGIPSPDTLEKIIEYEYELVGDLYKPSGIHYRLLHSYMILFEDALFNSSLAPEFFDFIDSYLTDEKKKMFNMVTRGNTFFLSSPFTHPGDCIAELWIFTLFLDKKPTTFLTEDLKFEFSFALNVSHFFYEKEQSRKFHYIYTWLFEKDDIIQSFKDFLKRKRSGAVRPQIFYNQIAFDYLSRDLGDIILNIEDKEIIEIFINRIESWADVKLRPDHRLLS
jgi:hypothetical protein